MNWIARNLWELLKPPKPRQAKRPRAKEPQPSKSTHSRRPMQLRYDVLVSEMKQQYGVRVRKWRSSMSGCAWMVHGANGSSARLIEAPYPRGPMSCAIFLHEIGHHAIGFGTHRPRCLEEYHAWKWAVDTMRDKRFNVTPSVERRMAESLRYAVAKAVRRGLKRLPEELIPYLSGEVRTDKS